jgi:hypothetical protein
LFLVDERDSLGRGSGKTTAPVYKSVVVANAEGASDIAGSIYDRIVGQPGQANLPSDAAGLGSAGLHAVARQDLLNIVDSSQLAKFGLNANADTKTGISADMNSISDKWEGLTLMPFYDPLKPNEFLLLIGNDNDFKANAIYENGVLVGGTGANGVEPGAIDTLLLAYDVTLPFDTTAPEIESITPSTATLWPPDNRMVPVELTVALSDNSDANPRAHIVSVQRSEPAARAPRNGADFEVTGPLSLNLRAQRDPNGPGRVYTITVQAIDASGNTSTETVTVSVPRDQSVTR